MIVKVTNNDIRDHQIPLSVGMIRFRKGKVTQVAAALTQRDIRALNAHRKLSLSIDNTVSHEGLPKTTVLGSSGVAEKQVRRPVPPPPPPPPPKKEVLPPSPPGQLPVPQGKTGEILPNPDEMVGENPEDNDGKSTEVTGSSEELPDPEDTASEGGNQESSLLDSMKNSQVEAAQKSGAMGGK